MFGDLKMSPREPQFQQIPTNGRKSKCYIVIQRYRSVSLVTVGSGEGELPSDSADEMLSIPRDCTWVLRRVAPSTVNTDQGEMFD